MVEGQIRELDGILFMYGLVDHVEKFELPSKEIYLENSKWKSYLGQFIVFKRLFSLLSEDELQGSKNTEMSSRLLGFLDQGWNVRYVDILGIYLEGTTNRLCWQEELKILIDFLWLQLQYSLGIGQLWPTDQIQPATCFHKIVLEHNLTHCVYVLLWLLFRYNSRIK